MLWEFRERVTKKALMQGLAHKKHYDSSEQFFKYYDLHIFWTSSSFLTSPEATIQGPAWVGESYGPHRIGAVVTVSIHIRGYPSRHWELCWDPLKTMNKMRFMPSQSSKLSMGWITNSVQVSLHGGVFWETPSCFTTQRALSHSSSVMSCGQHCSPGRNLGQRVEREGRAFEKLLRRLV